MPALNISTDNLAALTDPNKQSDWLAFFLSSVITFVVGIIIILTCKLIQYVVNRTMNKNGFMRSVAGRFGLKDDNYRKISNEEEEWYDRVDFLSSLREISRELISAQRQSGRFLAVCVLIFSIGSLVLYIIDTYRHKVESSLPWLYYKLQVVDFFFNMFFLLFFFIRFIAAHNKLAFWFELSSLVDFFTVPPSFVAIYLKRNWLGFRFLRAVRLINIPDLLQHTGILRSSRSISVAKLGTNFAAFLICTAGFVHLVENSGDVFLNFSNARHLDFLDCLYFMLVTLTTVGYGDIVCVTYTGKAFMLAFLIAGLAFFAMLVPQLSMMFGVDRRFTGSYHSVRGRKHVVVCGEINFRSLEAVIEDFFHPDREESKDIDVCVVHTATPSIEFEALVKRHSPHINYYIGSVMKRDILEKVLIRVADACIILTDRQSPQPSEVDFANIMRVIAIKNYSPKTRILLQLLHYHNKPIVLNIPNWNLKDEIICISEIKLGLLSQSCLAFGFSTMMANVFRVISNDAYRRTLSWRDLYSSGASLEIYTCTFSKDFEGKTFKSAALTCFKLGVLLVAVEHRNPEDRTDVLINPGDRFVIDLEHTRGFVLANSSEEAKRIRLYCEKCHTSGGNILIPKAACVHTKETNKRKCNNHSVLGDSQSISETAYLRKKILSRHLLDEFQPRLYNQNSVTENHKQLDQDPSHFDSSGFFYYCKATPIENAVLDVKTIIGSANSPVLKSHIILCLFANSNSPPIGLRSFVMPLRASNLTESELHPIIFVGDIDYFRKEWSYICNYPEIHILHGSPNSREVMTALNINACHACVIMSLVDRDNEDQCLIDKSAILCTLNIRNAAMTSRLPTSDLQLSIAFSSLERNSKHFTINIIKVPRTVTDLEIETNVQYVQEENEESNVELYRTSSFASGSAFVDTIIDYLISTSYYNDRALRVIRSMITGGVGSSLLLDMQMADATVIKPCENQEVIRNRYRSKITLLDLTDIKEKLSLPSLESVSFGTLFALAMQQLEMLCLGIYRLKYLLESGKRFFCKVENDMVVEEKRIVICFPSSLLPLHDTDQIYVIQQFQFEQDPPTK